MVKKVRKEEKIKVNFLQPFIKSYLDHKYNIYLCWTSLKINTDSAFCHLFSNQTVSPFSSPEPPSEQDRVRPEGGFSTWTNVFRLSHWHHRLDSKEYFKLVLWHPPLKSEEYIYPRTLTSSTLFKGISLSW